MKDLDLWIQVEEQPSWQRVFTDLRFNRPHNFGTYTCLGGVRSIYTRLL